MMLRGSRVAALQSGYTLLSLCQWLMTSNAVAFSIGSHQLREFATSTYAIMLSGVSLYLEYIHPVMHSSIRLDHAAHCSDRSSPHDLSTTIHHAHHQSNSRPP
jgi:hypothetical protein